MSLATFTSDVLEQTRGTHLRATVAVATATPVISIAVASAAITTIVIIVAVTATAPSVAALFAKAPAMPLATLASDIL